MGNNNSDIVVLIVSVSIVLLILLAFIISFLFIYKSRQAASDVAIKTMREKYTQEILKTELEIRDQTMKNISQEIHDNMGQVLSLVVLHLSSVEGSDPETAQSKVDNSTNLIKKVIHDLRDLSKSLDSGLMMRIGLGAAVRNELTLLEKTGKYRTFFTSRGQERRLDPSRETIIYRIVQESLNNIIKHARATEIHIALEFAGDNLCIAIEDNGAGFHTEEISNDVASNGAGLHNIRTRAGIIGGRVFIVSAPTAGTKVLLTVPVTGP